MSAIRSSVVMLAILVIQFVQAFEPFDVKKEPEETRAYDHLWPVDRAVPEFRYLAQYWTQPDREPQQYVVVVRDDSSGRCYVEQGSPPSHERVLNHPYKFDKRTEISSEMADLIHELWTNALLQTSYDRHGVSVVVTAATRCTFSTFVPNLGWMHGEMYYPTVEDLPPKWMHDAGEALFVFVTTSHDQQQLKTQISAIRGKLYEYMKTHERPADR